MTTEQLLEITADLLAIDREGNLGAVQIAFAEDCHKAGGMPTADERARELTAMQIGEATKARDIARVVNHMFGVPMVEAERAAREVLVIDRWAEIAREVIAHFKPTSPAVPTKQTRPRNPTAEEDANWNPWTHDAPKQERKW